MFLHREFRALDLSDLLGWCGNGFDGDGRLMTNDDRRWFRPRLESLEAREVPAGVTATLQGGILTVVGTAARDEVTISYGGGRATVRSTSYDTGVARTAVRSFPTPAVRIVVVAAEGGNDAVVITGTRESWVYGGTGNDVLYGGWGPDGLWGGHGNDKLYGRGANDVLCGGSGSDLLQGGAGNNALHQESLARAVNVSSLEAEVVQLVNLERARAGLPPLTVNTLLTSAARRHSSNMASWSNSIGGQAMQHTLIGTTTPTPSTRLDFAGYQDWRAWGENIAYGYATAQQVVTAWMNSPGHRANILNATFTEIGVGAVTNASGQIFWTQNFGTR